MDLHGQWLKMREISAKDVTFGGSSKMVTPIPTGLQQAGHVRTVYAKMS